MIEAQGVNSTCKAWAIVEKANGPGSDGFRLSKLRQWMRYEVDGLETKGKPNIDCRYRKFGESWIFEEGSKLNATSKARRLASG